MPAEGLWLDYGEYRHERCQGDKHSDQKPDCNGTHLLRDPREGAAERDNQHEFEGKEPQWGFNAESLPRDAETVFLATHLIYSRLGGAQQNGPTTRSDEPKRLVQPCWRPGRHGD